MKYKKIKVKKLIRVTFIGYFVSFIFLAIVKNSLPQTSRGWSDPPIYDYLFILIIGICILIPLLSLSYHSWIFDEERYIKWFVKEQIFSSDKAFTQEMTGIGRRIYPHGFIIWGTRLGTLSGVFVGLALIVYALISIFKYISGLFT